MPSFERDAISVPKGREINPVGLCTGAGDGDASNGCDAGTGGVRCRVSSDRSLVSALTRKRKVVSPPKMMVVLLEIFACCMFCELIVMLPAWGCFSILQEPLFQSRRAWCLATFQSSSLTVSIPGSRPILVIGLS